MNFNNYFKKSFEDRSRRTDPPGYDIEDPQPMFMGTGPSNQDILFNDYPDYLKDLYEKRGLEFDVSEIKDDPEQEPYFFQMVLSKNNWVDANGNEYVILGNVYEDYFEVVTTTVELNKGKDLFKGETKDEKEFYKIVDEQIQNIENEMK